MSERLTIGRKRRARSVAVRRASTVIERLGAADLMLVWPEEMGWPQDIGALAILDGRRLIDGDGRFPIEEMREHIRRRLHLVPRFRQLLFWPRVGFGWPLWVDAPSFDIDDHVGVLPVAPPGDDTQLLRACDELRRRPLKRSRPLWEMWFLPGLPLGNRQAHHGHGPSCPDAWPGLPSRVEVTMRLERVAKAIELVVIEMGVDPDTVRPILGAKLRELDAISEN